MGVVAMRGNRDNAFADVHPQMLRVGGESDRKPLAEDHRRRIGRLVERAIVLLDITKQDAAFRMGYTDQGPVSRWCSGVERPLLDKLFTIDGFENAWLIAQAEQNPSVRLETVMSIPRKASL